jgi:hypothetical protein
MGRKPRQHDTVLGYTSLLEIGGDAILGAVTVNPEFLIPQFHVHNRAMTRLMPSQPMVKSK